jgi:hypothetical protein
MTAEYRDNEQAFHEYYDEIEICLESAKSTSSPPIKSETGQWLTGRI